MVTKKTKIELAREDLIDTIKFKNQAEIAKAIDVSAACISTFAAGKYQGDNGRIADKLNNYFNSSNARKQVAGQSEYVRTQVAIKIEKLIETCIRFSGVEGKIGVITGDGGHGKSHCCREYARNHPACVYTMLDDCMHTKAVFAAIAKEIGTVEMGSISKIAEAIVEKLKDRETVVVLDEASSLNVGQLNKLRQIIVIRSKTPLILVGNRDITRTITQSTVRYGYESLDQFTSRMMAAIDLDDLAKTEQLYAREDLLKLFEYGGKTIADDGLDALQEICRSHRTGRLRVCSHIIAALHSSSKVGSEITADLIITAVEQLGLPVRPYMPIAKLIAERKKVKDNQRFNQDKRIQPGSKVGVA